MSSFDPRARLPTDYLLGVEIGRTRVRLVLVDAISNSLADVIEQPLDEPGGSHHSSYQEFRIRAALEDGLDRLGGGRVEPVMVGATVGFENSGVGSGPALVDWLQSLARETGHPMVYAGHPGVSYAPFGAIDLVRRVFDRLPVRLDRVELAPVAAARVLGNIEVGRVGFGSGVGWSARILDGQVLEAFEVSDRGADDPLVVVSEAGHHQLSTLVGVEVDPGLLRHRGVDVADVAPAVGVAIGLVSSVGSNLLDAEVLGRAEPTVSEVSEVSEPSSEHPIFEPSPDWDPPSLPSQFDDGGLPSGDSPESTNSPAFRSREFIMGAATMAALVMVVLVIYWVVF